MTPRAGVSNGRSATRLAIAISGINVAVIIGAWCSSHSRDTPPVATLVALMAAFGVVRTLQMRLYFSQHRVSLALTDAVVVSALFFTGPLWLGLAACAGELLYSLPNRTPALKTVFNSSSHAAIGVVTGSVFSALGGLGQPGPGTWLPALTASGCWSILNAVVMSAVISRAEGARMRRTLKGLVPTACVTTLLATPVGILVVELLRSGPLYVLLLVPVAAGIGFNSRYATLQRSEHLRVGRLYETASRSAQLSEDLDILSTIAEDGRLLVTGSASICIVREAATSPWAGRTARPGGVGGTRASDVEHLLQHAGDWDGTTLVLPVPEPFRALAPAADVMMVARSPHGSAVELVLAVFRERSGGRHVEAGVGETLAAFAAHGAVMAANASLVRKLQRALASQMEANQRKDEFVATISHELRTPLTVMLGAAQTLSRLQERLDASDRQRLLQTAVDQGERLKLLIEDLLLVAAAEQNDKQPCHLLALATGQLSDDLKQDIPDSHASLVNVVNRAPAAEVLTERFKVRQLVGNLVQNAIKYAPGSRVDIVIEEAGSGVLVSVADHGPGIPEEDRERVFERFLQLDQSSTRSQGGTGLGLYICRKLAKQIDAGLELRETPGGGCTFVLQLPRRLLRRAGDASAGCLPLPRAAAEVGMLRRPVVVPIGGPPEHTKELI